MQIFKGSNFALLMLVLSINSTHQVPVQAQALDGFQMPSGNIACMVFDKVLRCDINNNLATLPPRPTSCDLDWGFAYTMGQKTKPAALCAGDTVFNSSLPILAYGKSWNSQGFSCKSSKQGLTCQNTNKKGWFINRIQQKLF